MSATAAASAGASFVRPVMHVLRLAAGQLSIFDQLCLEEALLRSDKRNWCVMNYGQSPPVIVMGISGKPDALLHREAVRAAQVPVVRRFTGGGTVITDEGTVFTSFICNKADIPGQPLFPRDVMRWSEGVYSPIFNELTGGGRSGSTASGSGSGSRSSSASSGSSGGSSPTHGSAFSLREHDYALGDRKIGGNAQSVSRERWVHHTSFLWDFEESKMSLLRVPENRPAYRKDRPHTDFLTPISTHVIGNADAAKESFFDGVLRSVEEVVGMRVRAMTLEDAREVLARPQERASSNVYVEV